MNYRQSHFKAKMSRVDFANARVLSDIWVLSLMRVKIWLVRCLCLMHRYLRYFSNYTMENFKCFAPSFNH